ncbi:MAG TPA: SRPBCC domain-containing protein [Rhizomicrobium sp.]|jgi:uncharacterized protein YndB with AHSA1/START domain
MNTELKNELTIVRVLNAPRERVWRACRESEALKQWWGQPKDATMLICEVDFRVGGSLLCGIERPGDARIWFKWTYREIVDGEELVMEQHLSDETGSERDSTDFPASMVTLRLEDMNGKTKLTIVHAGMASEVNRVENFKEGWSQSLDRLAESLTHR